MNCTPHLAWGSLIHPFSTATFFTYPTECWKSLAGSSEVSAAVAPSSSGRLHGLYATAAPSAPTWLPTPSPPGRKPSLTRQPSPAPSLSVCTDAESGKPGLWNYNAQHAAGAALTLLQSEGEKGSRGEGNEKKLAAVRRCVDVLCSPSKHGGARLQLFVDYVQVWRFSA